MTRPLDQPPETLAALGSLAELHLRRGDLDAAQRCLQALCDACPDHAPGLAGLGRVLQWRGDLDGAARCFEAVVSLEPDSAAARNDLGLVRLDAGEASTALRHFEAALAKEPGYVPARHNLGLAHYRRGDLDAAVAAFEAVLDVAPASAVTHNELGNVLVDSGDVAGARASFERALDHDPSHVDALWNLSGVAADIHEACTCLERCLARNPDHEASRMMLAGLRACLGERGDFDSFCGTNLERHPFLRSFRWVLSRSPMPDIHFDRWRFFDAILAQGERRRPFYEFGVWRGRSFAYLLRHLGAGTGFDSFEGLPEDWHEHPAGSYSADGSAPSLRGSEFVVGRFEETLPDYFACDRPRASLVHLDADLYSSTLCALIHAQKVIDARTIIVFDELLMNDAWEQDEYAALEEFCRIHDRRYEVIAVSFFTKQVAIRFTD